jgi:hypothetical protein
VDVAIFLDSRQAFWHHRDEVDQLEAASAVPLPRRHRLADLQTLMQRRVLAVATLAAIGIAILASVLATPYGLGVTPDSLLYLHAAGSLRQGLGLVVPAYDGSLVPLTHYPPLFPATLALASIAGGIDLPSAARTVSLIVAAGNILAVTIATHAFTRSGGAAAATAFVMALSVDMLFLNTAIWSDGQFVLLEVVCLVLTTNYLQGRGYRYLVLGALTAALACLSRWAGGTTVITATLAIVLLGPGSVRRRLADGVLFGLLASAPPLAWMAHNAAVAGSTTNRSFRFSGASPDDVAAMIQTISSWLLPGTNRIYILARQDTIMATCAAMAALTLAALARRFVRPAILDRSALVRTPVVFLLFVPIYLAAVLAATSFIDSAVPLDNRILAPVYVAVVIVTAFVLHAAFRSIRERRWRIAGIGLLAAFLLGNAVVTVGAAAFFHREGRGFAGPAWQYPVLRRALAAVEQATPVFSNHPGGVEFALGRMAQDVSPEVLASALARQRVVVLVYFEDPRSYAPRNPQADKMAPSTDEYRIELLRGLSATLVASERNGRIYRLEPASDHPAQVSPPSKFNAEREGRE